MNPAILYCFAHNIPTYSATTCVAYSHSPCDVALAEVVRRGEEE